MKAGFAALSWPSERQGTWKEYQIHSSLSRNLLKKHSSDAIFSKKHVIFSTLASFFDRSYRYSSWYVSRAFCGSRHSGRSRLPCSCRPYCLKLLYTAFGNNRVYIIIICIYYFSSTLHSYHILNMMNRVSLTQNLMLHLKTTNL